MTHVRPLTEIEKQILDAVHQIKFGTVEVVIHDSRVVQIQRSEKMRFNDKKD